MINEVMGGTIYSKIQTEIPGANPIIKGMFRARKPGMQ